LSIPSPRPGLTLLALSLLPGVAAIWTVPGFVTQDGPAHLYNAQILAESLRADAPSRAFYRVRWEPLPNWAGHLALIGLMTALPPRTADRVMTTITLIGFAGSITWLRWKVAGAKGFTLAAPLAGLLALNLTWLMGFTSFLLGACLFPITLGAWWIVRDRPGLGQAIGLAGLLVLGYFCHLVSLGLTAVGLVVLAATTPGPGRAARWRMTLASLLPLVPLGLAYRALMRAGGSVTPIWGHLKDPLSPRSWFAQATWADPISLGSKALVPFFDMRSPWCGILAPVAWAVAALTLFALPSPHRRPDRRGWTILALLLLAGGLACPDTLGPTHGNYLPQRVVLLGLVALVPALALDPTRRSVRFGGAALAMALVLQSLQVWDYALDADRRAGAIASASEAVGRNQRVGTLLIGIRGRYRANPLMHADCLLGVGTGNVLWSNYETAHYYFPVQFRDDVPRPPAGEFEQIARLDGPGEGPARAERWGSLLADHHGSIDTLVVWGADPALDAINARWFGPHPIYQAGGVRILRRQETGDRREDGRQITESGGSMIRARSRNEEGHRRNADSDCLLSPVSCLLSPPKEPPLSPTDLHDHNRRRKGESDGVPCPAATSARGESPAVRDARLGRLDRADQQSRLRLRPVRPVRVGRPPELRDDRAGDRRQDVPAPGHPDRDRHLVLELLR
jgi:hypothetical protein